MGRKTGNPSTKVRRRSVKKSKTRTLAEQARSDAERRAGNDLAKKRFVDDLLIRGEAAKLTKKGKLPGHATHVIKRQNQDGTVEVERVRYKTF